MRDHPLRRNRDFRILCAVQGLSKLGTQASSLAIPLLVLHTTRSPGLAGLIGCTVAAAQLAVLLPAGALADRYHRRLIMLACELGAAAAMAALTAAILLGRPGLPLVLAAGVVVAVLGAVFHPASAAVLPQIVSAAELPSAIAVNQARNSAAYLAGPILGGFLFGISTALPFAVDTASYLISVLGILALRTPLHLSRPPGKEPSGVLRNITAGVRFLWRTPYLRSTLVTGAVMNFAFSGIFLVVLVAIVQHGSSGLTAGLVIAFAGGGSLLGSLLAPRSTGLVSQRQLILLITWSCAALVSVMALAPTAPALALLLAAASFLPPVLNVVFGAVQMLVTPDHLQGRVQSATGFVAMSMAPLGPVTAGLLLERWPPAAVFAVFALTLAALAALNTFNPHLHHAPDLRSSGTGKEPRMSPGSSAEE